MRLVWQAAKAAACDLDARNSWLEALAKGGCFLKEETCRAAGIDYAKGLERFMGNEALYLEFLSKFLYDGSFQEFWAGTEMGDISMAEKAIDTLKGSESQSRQTLDVGGCDRQRASLGQGGGGNPAFDLRGA